MSEVTVGFPDSPGFGKVDDAGDLPQEARALGVTVDDVRLWSLYVPNGRELDNPHYPYKLEWLAALAAATTSWLAAKPDLKLALMGDFNIAPLDTDVWDIAAFEGRTHVSQPERDAFTAFQTAGLTDVLRSRGIEGYTYWDYQQLRFPRNEGHAHRLHPGLAGLRRGRHSGQDRAQRAQGRRSERSRAPRRRPRHRTRRGRRRSSDDLLMPHLDVPGGRIYYETEGSPAAPAVLLVHAGIANLRMWDAQIDGIARDHFAIRFDSRGFGRTETADVEYTEQADALAVLDHLGVAVATVIGCSRGGGIAIDLALESPARCAGLVLVGAALGGFPEGELTPAEQRVSDAIDAAEEAGQWALANRLETEIWDFGPTRSIDALDPGFVELAYQLNSVNLAHRARHRRVFVSTRPHTGESATSMSRRSSSWETTTSPRFSRVRPTSVRHSRTSSSFASPQAAHIPSVERPEDFEMMLLDWLHLHGL